MIQSLIRLPICILTGMVQAQTSGSATTFGAASTAQQNTSETPDDACWETVNRVVYPLHDADQTMPLYAVNWHPAYFDPSVFDERENLYSANPNGMTRSELARLIAQGGVRRARAARLRRRFAQYGHISGGHAPVVLHVLQRVPSRILAVLDAGE